MIEANRNEPFPITVTLLDEDTGELATGEQVFYDIRLMNDAELSPPINGLLGESTVNNGIYKSEVSIPSSGIYICYATCSGFLAGTEEIIIQDESLYELSKANSPHNISVIDVPRTTVSGSTSQISRNVPLDKTDYIVSIVKKDSDSDWSNPVTSGISYAHYRTMSSELPFMMGGPF